MANVALLLGPIAFNDFEVPASINIGGVQRLAIHRLPGGMRVIDALGQDDSDISFSGAFSGPDATLRARSIDEMRAAGLPMPLTWDVFYYSVIIRTFEANYRSSWWIPYHLSCTVVTDETRSSATSVIPLTQNVISDVTTATTLATAAGIDLSNAQNAVGMPGATVRGTGAYSMTSVTLAGASALVGSGASEAETTLMAASWPTADQIPSAINTLNSAVSAAQQIASLRLAQAYLGRAGTNLANAST